VRGGHVNDAHIPVRALVYIHTHTHTHTHTYACVCVCVCVCVGWVGGCLFVCLCVFILMSLIILSIISGFLHSKLLAVSHEEFLINSM
jgi:hypothetical protein